MSSVVAQLEEKFRVPFENLAKRLSDDFPYLSSAKVESHPFGFDEYLGHSMHVSCLLHYKHALSEADNVALSISLSKLTSTPKLNADVCWGHPSGYLEAEFTSSDLDFNDETLEKLYADLPRLSESLIEAVRRRKPKIIDVH
jgi:hypothetical protein